MQFQESFSIIYWVTFAKKSNTDQLHFLHSLDKTITLHTEVHFAGFLSAGFTTMAVINPLEIKLAKRTFEHCAKVQKYKQSKIGLQFFDMWYL
jgi:hypothetical protein